MLSQTFIELAGKYSNNFALIESNWKEIEKNYSDKKRHYHTLAHLENLLTQLTELKGQISDWDTILFSLYYHDIIYNATSSDNEEKSAELAKERLENLNFPQEKIKSCVAQILTTKSHTVSDDADINLFTDADLSILGEDWKIYEQYFKQVRKEYSIYPDFLYNPGRKKVLQHFLNMKRIFKTDHFYDKLESQARENLKQELEIL